MNDDELIAGLKGTPPVEVTSNALFWARLQRDVGVQLARRRFVVRIGSIAAAAALAIGLFAARAHFVVHPHQDLEPAVAVDVLEGSDEPEAGLGVAVEELSDEEITQAMKNFPRGG